MVVKRVYHSSSSPKEDFQDILFRSSMRFITIIWLSKRVLSHFLVFNLENSLLIIPNYNISVRKLIIDIILVQQINSVKSFPSL